MEVSCHDGRLGVEVSYDLLPPTWAAKALQGEIFARRWRRTAFRSEREGPPIAARWLRSRCVFGTFFFQGLSSEPSSSTAAPRKFRRQNFLRGIGAMRRRVAAWEARNCGQSVALAGCLWRSLPPTCAAKIWDAEILAKHRRYAASRLRRMGPKIVVSWLHSRFAVGTFFFQGLPLEPSSSKVAPQKFWMPKFVPSIGATQCFDRNAGGPKLWQVCCISGLSSELASANLGRENFANRNFGEARQRFARNAGWRKRGRRDIALRIRRVRGAWGAKNLSTEKEGQKKKSREFPLVFTCKNHPVGWCYFVNVLFVLSFRSFPFGGFALQLNSPSTSWCVFKSCYCNYLSDMLTLFVVRPGRHKMAALRGLIERESFRVCLKENYVTFVQRRLRHARHRIRTGWLETQNAAKPRN